MSNDVTRYDDTRLRQVYHDTAIFEETVAILDRFYEPPERKSACISSENLGEVQCDYFKDAKFSRR